MKSTDNHSNCSVPQQSDREWKPIPGHPDYSICRAGLILSRKNRKWRTLCALRSSGSSFRRVTLDGKTYRFEDLVARCFLGDPPHPEAVIGFRNGARWDCNASNLYWHLAD